MIKKKEQSWVKPLHCIICMSSKGHFVTMLLLSSDCTSHYFYIGTKMYLIKKFYNSRVVCAVVGLNSQSWRTIQLYFTERKKTGALTTVLHAIKNLGITLLKSHSLRNVFLRNQEVTSESHLSYVNIFEEIKMPESSTNLSHLMWEVFLWVPSLLHRHFSKKLSKFTLKYRNFWKHQVKTSGLTNVCNICLTNVWPIFWTLNNVFFHSFLIHRPAYFLFQYYRF